jgi:GNAT superfamily N-acetyltransferase
VVTIQVATSDAEIKRCHPVMVQLRPHVTEVDFLPAVRRQQLEGFELAFLESAGQVRAVAGFRVHERLYGGKEMYVDDLATDADHRSKGHGKLMLDWLIDRARSQGCQLFALDSGVQRFEAHRFYLVNRMLITAHHFTLKL